LDHAVEDEREERGEEVQKRRPDESIATGSRRVMGYRVVVVDVQRGVTGLCSCGE
jgi:hypothetical protein